MVVLLFGAVLILMEYNCVISIQVKSTNKLTYTLENCMVPSEDMLIDGNEW